MTAAWPSLLRPRSIRGRLTLLYLGGLTLVLFVYMGIVFAFQYGLLTSQIYHDEMQDMETVEGLLYFDSAGALHLREDYLSHPQSHLLIDRLMEVRATSGAVLYRSITLQGQQLGAAAVSSQEGEGPFNFDEHTTRLADGSHVLMISHRHPVQGRTVVIRLGYGLSPLASRMEHFLAALLLAIPLALLAAGLIVHRFVRRALLPLELMTVRAEQITATSLDGRLVISDAHDELGRMGQVLNSLFSRLQASFAQLERFTADAAHELKTPLTSIRAVGEGALGGRQDSQLYAEAVSNILEEVARLNQTVEGLLLLSKVESDNLNRETTCFSLSKVAQEVIELVSVLAEERSLTILMERSQAEDAIIRADRTLIRASVLNVLHNAIKFSTAGGSVTIRLGLFFSGQDSWIRLTIQDSGPGIEQQDREHVFERFYRGRHVQSFQAGGSGLGLAIARLAIGLDGGRIYFDPTSLTGATCHIELPVQPASI